MLSMSKFNSKTSKLALSLIFVATLAACGGSDDDQGTLVVSAPVAMAVDQKTAPAATTALVAAKSMSFPAGIPLLGTNSPTTLVFTAPTTGNTDVPFTMTSAGVTSVGNLTFGSCKFTLNERPQGTKLATPLLLADIPTAQCTLRVDTTNAAADGSAKQRGLTLTLGGVTSSPAQVPVVVNANGTVTVNGQTIGTGNVVQITGAAS